MPLKIAVVVHGRFYAFDVVRELTKLGHDVTLFTNYSCRETERFGIPRDKTRSFQVHRWVTVGLNRLLPARFGGAIERYGNASFARWAAAQVRKSSWDVVFAFSGVAEETFLALRDTPTVKFLIRASTHIVVQHRLLAEEEERSGAWVEKPSAWIQARETREYALADAIHVLSRFTYDSFMSQGVPADKVYQLSLGVSTQGFSASPEILAAREARLRAGEPLHVLYVGTFSCRKGAFDLVKALPRLPKERFSFRFVGALAKDAQALKAQLQGVAEFLPSRPQHELPEAYAWGDIFILPTIEDGSPVVLSQALAAGLPLLTTAHCNGPELVREGQNGWIIPIRSPDAILERLRWCDEHREEMARMIRTVAGSSQDRDWSETGKQMEQHIHEAIARKRN